MPNPFFIQIIISISKQFSLNMSTQFNCQKTFLFQAIKFSQTILIQTIQFSISIDFVYTQLNVKTVIFQIIQFSISTVSISKTVLFQTIQFSISMQFSSI